MTHHYWGDQGANHRPDPQWKLDPQTLSVRGGLTRTGFGETSEALFLNSGFTYATAEQAEASFAEDIDHFLYSRFHNPTVSMFENRLAALEGAVIYGYEPKKPDKPYRHLMIFLELLQQETKTKLPKVDVVAVTAREFLDIVEVNGLVWTEPLTDASAKPRGSGLLWFVEEDTFKIFIVNFKNPARILLLEQFLTHLILLTEWESSVRNVSPEDTDVLVDKRKEEWEKREGEAYALFSRISGNWHLLQLDWPPVLSQRPKIFSIPLPWPPWP